MVKFHQNLPKIFWGDPPPSPHRGSAPGLRSLGAVPQTPAAARSAAQVPPRLRPSLKDILASLAGPGPHSSKYVTEALAYVDNLVKFINPVH